jgi:DNA-binding Lrp family transcriptional regulator
MTRIRFDGLAFASQPVSAFPQAAGLRSGHPNETGQWFNPSACTQQGGLPRQAVFAGLQHQIASRNRHDPLFRLSALLTRARFRRPAMIAFFVQIKCELGRAYEVANALSEAEIASEIYSTAGNYDLLVKFYVERGTDIGHFINEKVQVIPGIRDTYTIITFKAF